MRMEDRRKNLDLSDSVSKTRMKDHEPNLEVNQSVYCMNLRDTWKKLKSYSDIKYF